jgi:hypothetical protein
MTYRLYEPIIGKFSIMIDTSIACSGGKPDVAPNQHPETRSHTSPTTTRASSEDRGTFACGTAVARSGRMLGRFARVLLLTGTAACGAVTNPSDAGLPALDAGTGSADSGVDGGPDAGAPDSGSTPDAGDAGNFDAGASDAGPAGGCPGPYVLCDSFENGIDAGTWTEQGTPVLDNSRAHSGSYSVLFDADNTLLRTTVPFPDLAENLWGRAFVYMDQLPPGSTSTEEGPNASFAWAAGNMGDTRVGFRHTRYSGGYNYPGYDFTNTDSQIWPQDQWVCVEWHYQSNGDAGTQDYWMNGVELTDMHFDAHPMPPFTYFWIGQYLFGEADGGVPFTMWMDDVALDTAQIGCEL